MLNSSSTWLYTIYKYVLHTSVTMRITKSSGCIPLTNMYCIHRIRRKSLSICVLSRICKNMAETTLRFAFSVSQERYFLASHPKMFGSSIGGSSPDVTSPLHTGRESLLFSLSYLFIAPILNILGGVYISIMFGTALWAGPFSYRKPIITS